MSLDIFVVYPEFAFGAGGGGGDINKVQGLVPNRPIPMAPMAGSGGGSASTSNLKAVKRVRNVFPETWLWTNKTTG